MNKDLQTVQIATFALTTTYEKLQNTEGAIDQLKKHLLDSLGSLVHASTGSYGDRKKVETKEQADHSLFYLIAVAILDGDIWPEQFEPERINREDVQELLQKVSVNTKFPLHKPLAVAGLLDPYTEAYPEKMKAKVEITLKDGKKLTAKREDYPGFYTRPFTWEQVIAKFRRLCNGTIPTERQQQIIDTVKELENLNMEVLIDLLSEIK